jgi:hypothetical protein
METTGLLRPENDVHLWAPHFVFLPRINRELFRFLRQWNNHGIRAQGHSSPLQLFVSAALHLCLSDLTLPREFFNQPDYVTVNNDLSTVSYAPEVGQSSLNGSLTPENVVNVQRNLLAVPSRLLIILPCARVAIP